MHKILLFDHNNKKIKTRFVSQEKKGHVSEVGVRKQGENASREMEKKKRMQPDQLLTSQEPSLGRKHRQVSGGTQSLVYQEERHEGSVLSLKPSR